MSSAETATYTTGASLHVFADWEPVVASPSALARIYRAIKVNTGGTLTVKLAGSGGVARAMVFADGETRYGLFTHVTSLGACTNVEGGV